MPARVGYENRSHACPAPTVVFWHEERSGKWNSIAWLVVKHCGHGNGRLFRCSSELTAQWIDHEGNRTLPLAVREGMDYVGIRQGPRMALRAAGVRSIPRGPNAWARRDELGLTARQRDVLEALRQGLSNREIADRLHRSRRAGTGDAQVPGGGKKVSRVPGTPDLSRRCGLRRVSHNQPDARQQPLQPSRVDGGMLRNLL